MPIALVVAQLADNAFVSAEAILGVMLGTGQIGLVGNQPSMQQNWVPWAARRLAANAPWCGKLLGQPWGSRRHESCGL